MNELALELPVIDLSAKKSKGSKGRKAKQEELELEAPSRGRFEKASETIWKGENLDQPTYKRRGLYIRL